MQKSIAKICKGFSFSGDIATDAVGLLIHHGRGDVAQHVLAVASQAQSIADRFNVDTRRAQCAGFLHDKGFVAVQPKPDFPWAQLVESLWGSLVKEELTYKLN